MTRKYGLIAIDIDGTLTRDRGSVELCLEAINLLRIIDRKGIRVSLVSSNALPVVVALKKYMGFTGPAIGETGALVYFGDNEVHHLTNISTRRVLEDVLKQFKEYVYSSWQNTFRLYDYALIIKREYRGSADRVYGEIKGYVEEKYECIRVGYSGYAIHLTPCNVSKGKALKYVINRLGLDKREVIGIGDSFMDIDFLRECGLSIAVGNADEELKQAVDLVLDKPSCIGVIEYLKTLI